MRKGRSGPVWHTLGSGSSRGLTPFDPVQWRRSNRTAGVHMSYRKLHSTVHCARCVPPLVLIAARNSFQSGAVEQLKTHCG